MKGLAGKVFLWTAALGLGALSTQGCDAGKITNYSPKDPGETVEIGPRPRPVKSDTVWADIVLAGKVVAYEVDAGIYNSPAMEAGVARAFASGSMDSLYADVLSANEVRADTADAWVYSAPGIAGAAKRDTLRVKFVKVKKLITHILDA